MNSNKGKDKFLVVYQITNMISSKIYIGAHTTYNKNDKYMGSSKSLKEDIKKLGRENFKKEILCECSTKEDMMKKEAEYVTREFCHRSDTYNRHIGGSDNFTMDGMVTVINPEGGYMKVYDDDPRWLSGELKSMMKGTIMVKDKEGNCMRVSKNDERYLSGELVGTTKGNLRIKTLKIKIPKIKYITSDETKEKLRKKTILHYKNMTEEQKIERNKKNKRKMSEESKEKNRIAHIGQVSGMKDKKHSDETKEKIRKSLKGRIPWNKM